MFLIIAYRECFDHFTFGYIYELLYFLRDTYALKSELIFSSCFNVEVAMIWFVIIAKTSALLFF